MTEPQIHLDPREYRLENTLKWIRQLAAMHYFGGAFDPEHMRIICNMAADGLQESPSRRELPDFDESMEKAQKKARKWADKMSRMFSEDDDDA